MTTRRPSKPWRLLIPTANGPTYEYETSEAAIQRAAEAAKATTPGNKVVIQKWSPGGRWEEWLRWARHEGAWTAE